MDYLITMAGAPRGSLLPKWLYLTITSISFLTTVAFTYLLAFKDIHIEEKNYFLVTAFYGLCFAFLFFGLTEVVADVRGKVMGMAIKAGGPFGVMVTVLIFGYYLQGHVPAEYKFKVQLVGVSGPGDLPLANVPNGLMIVPTNGGQGLIKDIDAHGTSEFVLSDAYYQDSVYFQLTGKRFVLPDKRYKLSRKGEFVQLVVRPAKVNYRFRFVDASDANIRLAKVRFICDDLHINAVTDSLGLIDVMADTTGVQLYNFTITCPNYTYNNSVKLRSDQTHPIFQLEKKR